MQRSKKNVSLAEFLRNRRQELQLTQGQVALKMGFSSPQFISNWERGTALPPLHKLNSVRKVVRIYKLNVEDYIDRVLNEQRARILARLGEK